MDQNDDVAALAGHLRGASEMLGLGRRLTGPGVRACQQDRLRCSGTDRMYPRHPDPADRPQLERDIPEACDPDHEAGSQA